MRRTMVASALVVGLLSACATPVVVETKKGSDVSLSCDAIKDEIEVADKYLQAARKDRTVTGNNVAAAILFWPALIGTYANTEEAITAANERKGHLTKLAEKKNCVNT